MTNQENNCLHNEDRTKIEILEKRLNILIKEMNKEFKIAIETEEFELDEFMVSTLHAKIGNKFFSFDLDE